MWVIRNNIVTIDIKNSVLVLIATVASSVMVKSKKKTRALAASRSRWGEESEEASGEEDLLEEGGADEVDEEGLER
jgi:hypothetical protein